MSGPEEAVAPDLAVLSVDTRSVITSWSEGAERMFGHEAADAVGRSLYMIMPEQYHSGHAEGFRAAMDDPVVREIVLDIPVVRADGRVRAYPGKLVVLSDAFGSPVGAVGIFRSEGSTGVGF